MTSRSLPAARDGSALDPIPADQVTGELITGTVQPFADRNRERKEAEQIIIDARDSACRLTLGPGRETEN